MALRPDIQGVIFDLDNTLYQKPPENNDIFARAAARSALSLGFRSTYEKALELARKSGEQYKSEISVFWREHGIDQKEIFRESHRVGVEFMRQAISRDQGLCDAFNHIAAGVKEVLILSHGSQAWVEQLTEHLGYAPALKPNRAFGLDHPMINYRTKDAGPEAFVLAASIMGLNPDKIAVVEDTSANLLHAHALGMQTVHVHWGSPVAPPLTHVHCQVASIRSIRP